MRYMVMAWMMTSFLARICFAGEEVVLKDEKDRMNYSLGYQMGVNLERQGMDVNPEVLVKGMRDALSKAEPLLTQQEMQETLKGAKSRMTTAKHEQKKQTSEQYRGEGREFLAENAKREGVVTLPSGLQYKVIREGTGKTPGPHDSVTVNYRGTLIDGTEFDSSYRRNEPATFRVDGVIAGWTEALQLMREGARWQLFIPPDMAYGERGALADKTLIFDVELISVHSGRSG